jgi:muconate cycloisomerase
MTVIAKIETILVELPTRRTHKWTGLNEPIGRYLLVKMTGTDGTVGWGEAPALKDWGGEFGRYFGESAAVVDLIIHRYLAPAVEGLSIGRPAELHRKMDAVVKGYPYAKAAIDFAYYDLSGKVLGLPVHALLGGLLRENVAVTHSIGLLEIEEAVTEVRKVAQDGIRTIKIKIGVDVARDIAIVKAIREAVGPEMKLCVDANEGYKTPGQAIQAVREMESVGLIYVEQPVMGIERIARVAQAIDQPVMADESAWNAHDVIQIVEQKAAQIV